MIGKAIALIFLLFGIISCSSHSTFKIETFIEGKWQVLKKQKQIQFEPCKDFLLNSLQYNLHNNDSLCYFYVKDGFIEIPSGVTCYMEYDLNNFIPFYISNKEKLILFDGFDMSWTEYHLKREGQKITLFNKKNEFLFEAIKVGSKDDITLSQVHNLSVTFEADFLELEEPYKKNISFDGETILICKEFINDNYKYQTSKLLSDFERKYIFSLINRVGFEDIDTIFPAIVSDLPNIIIELETNQFSKSVEIGNILSVPYDLYSLLRYLNRIELLGGNRILSESQFEDCLKTKEE